MNRLIPAAVALAFSLVPEFGHAVTAGQTDTFAGGSLDNWFAGGLGVGSVPPVPPSVQSTGGPAGAGDGYMLVTGLGGGGPGSRIAVINTAQWSGKPRSTNTTSPVTAAHSDATVVGSRRRITWSVVHVTVATVGMPSRS